MSPNSLIQTKFSFHHPSAHHGSMPKVKKKKNTVTALEVQNPSEKIGTAITEPAPSYTQELCVKRFFLSNNSSMNAHKPPTQVIIYCTEEDPLLFCVPIALVCIILL